MNEDADLGAILIFGGAVAAVLGGLGLLVWWLV